MIGKAQHAVLMLFAQPLCPRGVVLDLLCMEIAIHFDHQFGFGAEEIDDVSINRVLFWNSAPSSWPLRKYCHSRFSANVISFRNSRARCCISLDARQRGMVEFM